MKKTWTVLLAMVLACALLFGCADTPAAAPDVKEDAQSQPVAGESPAKETPAVDGGAQAQPVQSAAPTAVPPAASGPADALAKQFLDALENCPPVTEEDNRIGFGIARIEKDGDDYVVYWNSTNAMITGNPSNVAYAFSLITFYDPEDYANSYQGFTMENGKMNVDFAAGETISYDHVRVKLPTASQVVYLYFAGAENGPEELYTVPLFYTLILDDNPRVFEDVPRAANGLFGM